MNNENLEYKFLEAIYNKIDMGRLKAHVFKEANENSEISIAIFKKDGIVKIVKLNEKLEKQKLFYGDLMRLLDTAYAGLELKTEESFYKTYENFKEDLGEKLATTVKSNNTTVSSMDKAKELCSQASTVQSIANIDSTIVKEAIAICSEKVMDK